MIHDTVNKLINYAQVHLGMDTFDSIYFKNLLLNELELTHPVPDKTDLESIRKLTVPDTLVAEMKSYLVDELDYTPLEASLKITKIMGLLTKSPSEVNKQFVELEKNSPYSALSYLYDLSIKNDYIQKSKVDKNLLWTSDFGKNNIEISINLSKPEKSNKDIAKQAQITTDSLVKYPKCLLCLENLGFKGNATHPARENIRIIPVTLAKEQWYLQYSPYGYYNMHCIVFSKNHSNMVIEKRTFSALCDFVDRFPCFFIGSNADLPIVGGSILSHEHFQGGEHILPIMKAETKKEYDLDNYDSTRLFKLDWYNSCLLVTSSDKRELVDVATKILKGWRKYSDPENEIIASDETGEHNTITVAIRKIEEKYYLYLILRNNRCNEEFPDGIFHAHPEHHAIKKEGIGIIEAMGLFILPARLVRQSDEIKQSLFNDLSEEEILRRYPDLKDFLPMIAKLKVNYNPLLIDIKIREYINMTCRDILMNTAVFKDTEIGNKGFDKFIGGLNL